MFGVSRGCMMRRVVYVVEFADVPPKKKE